MIIGIHKANNFQFPHARGCVQILLGVFPSLTKAALYQNYGPLDVSQPNAFKVIGFCGRHPVSMGYGVLQYHGVDCLGRSPDAAS